MMIIMGVIGLAIVGILVCKYMANRLNTQSGIAIRDSQHRCQLRRSEQIFGSFFVYDVVFFNILRMILI